MMGCFNFFQVLRGEKIPLDGVVTAGKSSVNESLVTGESMPVSKEEGCEVIGGTVNLDNTLIIRVNKVNLSKQFKKSNLKSLFFFSRMDDRVWRADALSGPSCQGFKAHMWAQRADQGPLIYEGFYIRPRRGAQLGQP